MKRVAIERRVSIKRQGIAGQWRLLESIVDRR